MSNDDARPDWASQRAAGKPATNDETTSQDQDDPGGSNLSILRRGLFYAAFPLFFLNFVLPVQARDLGASAVEIGGLFTLFTISVLLIRPFVGIGLDRYGRRPFVLGALTFYVVSYGLFAQAEGIIAMYIARFLQGIAAAFMILAVDTITADSTTEETRSSQLGRNIESQTRGSIVGGTIGFTLIGAMPLIAWSLSFVIFAIAVLVALVLMWRGLPETLPPEARDAAPHKLLDVEVVVSGPLQRLMLILLVSAFAGALVQPIYLIYLQDQFDLPMGVLAWAFLPSAFIFALLPSRLGKLDQRWGAVNLLCIGFLTAGITYLLLPFIDRFIGLVIVYTISAIGAAMSEPARKTLTVRYGDKGAVGRTLGISELYAGIGGALGPLVGGLLYDTFNPSVAFLTNGVLMLSAALIARMVLKEEASKT
ncbi:MAG: MFS transporter [Pseudomonadota bacterium]